jgi:hypothetical protein
MADGPRRCPSAAAIAAARDHGVSSPVDRITARFRNVAEEEEAALRRATMERYRRMGMVDVPARH